MAPVNENPETTAYIADHKRTVTSLTDLPVDTMHEILGYTENMRSWWLKLHPSNEEMQRVFSGEVSAASVEPKTYPFDPFARFSNVSPAFKESVEARLSEEDRALIAAAHWQPDKLLGEAPKTVEEAQDFGRRLWVPAKMKHEALSKLNNIEWSRFDASWIPLESFETNPQRLKHTLFPRLQFDLLNFPANLPQILSEKINNPEIYQAIEEAYNKMEMINNHSGENMDLMREIITNSQKYEELEERYGHIRWATQFSPFNEHPQWIDEAADRFKESYEKSLSNWQWSREDAHWQAVHAVASHLYKTASTTPSDRS